MSQAQPSQSTRIRELIETFATAFILALVFRAYVVEAFVIPTGSMAPTLLGEHWQVRCPQCGWPFAVGWGKGRLEAAAPWLPTGSHAPVVCECPNCRFRLLDQTQRRGDGNNAAATTDFDLQYVQKGDRILVLKMPFDLAGSFLPSRWDVVVFKNPANPSENYIKRLVGLPGETLELIDGDLWVRGAADQPWTIARKPPHVQEAMYQIVFDNDFRPAIGTDRRDYPRWQVVGQPAMWSGLESRVFTFKPAAADSEETIALDGKWAIDFNGYNGINNTMPAPESPPANHRYVADLRLSAVVTPLDVNGELRMELTRRDIGLRAVVKYNGDVQIQRFTVGQPKADVVVQPQKPAAIKPGRPALVQFSQVDLEARLVIDGQEVARYDVDLTPAERSALASISDSPVSKPQMQLTAAGGALKVEHLRVDRDVYYRNAFLRADGLRIGDREPAIAGWATAGHPITLFKAGKPGENRGDDQFFVLGDNSEASLDGRLWQETGLNNAELMERLGNWRDRAAGADASGKRIYQLGTVPRDYMLGHAFFVYWPWAKPLGTTALPIVPNVGKMRFIK